MLENSNIRFQNDNTHIHPNIETEKRPEKLYRGFIINPDELTMEKLMSTLNPGSVSKNDPTKIGDGNELGVYMSTNLNVAQIYACGSNNNYIEAPYFSLNSAVAINRIELPSCGVIVEVDTKNLTIRKPKITDQLQGVYNSGFQGEEWIADSIGPEHYKIKKLILSVHPNDRKKIVIQVNDENENSLQEALNKIQIEYQKIKNTAQEFKEFLDGLSDNQRRNYFLLKNLWENKTTELENSKK